MKTQSGFISLSITGYIIAGLTVALLFTVAMLKLQSSRLESCQKEHAEFVARVEALGLEAQKKKVEQEKKDKLNKQKADDERKKLLARNADLSKRLRDSSNSGSMSGNSASTRIPESSCVKGGTINDALSKFTGRVESIAGRTAELIIEGQSAVDDLDNAKQWAKAAQD